MPTRRMLAEHRKSDLASMVADGDAISHHLTKRSPSLADKHCYRPAKLLGKRSIPRSSLSLARRS